MTISFNNSNGNLFNRLGALGELLRELRAYQGSLETDMTNATSGVTAELVGEPDLQALMGSQYIGALDSAGQVGQVAQQIAGKVADRIVFRDNPRPGQTLNTSQVTESLKEIIRQMLVQGASIQSQTVTGTPDTVTGQPGPHFIGYGNGVVNVSVRRWNGLTQENAYAEDLTLTCTQDSYTGNATVNRETFSITGAGAQTNRYAFNWPLGSGASATLQAIDSTSDNGNGNLLTNSDFASITSNAPANFTIVAGTAGTDIFEETTIVFVNGGRALRFVGVTGGSNPNLTQAFDVSTGTSGELDAATQYSWNAWLRRDGTAAAAGVMTVDLIDGSNVVIQDDQGANNSFTIDLTALTTAYTSYRGVFRTPSNPPSVMKLRIRITTALTDTRSIYLANMSMGEMVQVYSGGPSVTVHAGNIPFVVEDYASATITNNRGGATNLASFGPVLQRFFDLASLDLLFPSSSTPTIGDQLIS